MKFVQNQTLELFKFSFKCEPILEFQKPFLKTFYARAITLNFILEILAIKKADFYQFTYQPYLKFIIPHSNQES